MNCPACNDIVEILPPDDDGNYEMWCDCGFHQVIIEDVVSDDA